MSVETLLLKRRRALYTSDSSTVICTSMKILRAEHSLTTWLHVDDMLAGIQACCSHGAKGKQQQLTSVGTTASCVGAHVCRMDVALLHIADHSGKSLLDFGEPRHPHISHHLASCTLPSCSRFISGGYLSLWKAEGRWQDLPYMLDMMSQSEDLLTQGLFLRAQCS